MSIKTCTITSLGQFVDAVTPAAPDPRTGRRRDSGIYRGIGHVERKLLTSLDRLGGESPPHTKVGLEAHILRNFIRYSRAHLDRGTTHDEWELLVTAQHHGLPTRLLDWTYSPLVAAHFATASEGRVDRVVWRLDWQRVHRAFGLPELALLIDDVERLLGEDGRPLTPWSLFDRPEDARPFACMIEPPSIDARIVAQSAVFTLCSDRGRAFDDFLDAHGLLDALTRYIVPADVAPLLRDQLDIVTIDERRLFPDLDGVAAQMHRYYS